MSRIFISHSSRDNVQAAALKHWLADNGCDDVFLDIDPEKGLMPGNRWKNALTAATDRCEAVLCLLSPDWLDSVECRVEYRHAESLGKRIFAVVIAPCDTRDLPADWQRCDLFGDGRHETVRFQFREQPTEVSFQSVGLEKLKNGLKEAGLGAEHFSWPPENEPKRAPYRGLQPMDAVDAAIFFGRDAQIVRGLDDLRGIRESGVERLFVILGASGSGKSSFMRAGLLPRLTRDDRHFFPLPVIRPENSAITGAYGLAKAIEDALALLGQATTLAQVKSTLAHGGEGLNQLLTRIQRSAHHRIVTTEKLPPPTLIIAVDQAEELFTPEGSAEANLFLDLLSQYLGPHQNGLESELASISQSHAIAIFTIRSERYERLQTVPALAAFKTLLFDLKPIPQTEFKNVIEGPARRMTEAGRKLEIDPKLTERLLADSSGADALPLLAFTLERLFREHGGDGDLKLKEFEVMGGIEHIVEKAVELALSKPRDVPEIPKDQNEQLALLRRAFIPWLARINEDNNEPMRQIASMADLPAETHPLINRLINARLLLRDRRGENDIVEVAHESLLRQWPTLGKWLVDEAGALKTSAAVARAARMWEEMERDPDWLDLRAGRLIDAEELLQRPDYARKLGDTAKAYVQSCRVAENARINKELAQLERQRQIEEEKRHTAEEFAKRARKQRFVAFVITAIAIGAGLLAWDLKKQADEQKILAEARTLVAQAELIQNEQSFDPELYALLAIESIKRVHFLENDTAIRHAITLLPKPIQYVSDNTGIEEVELSADGKLLASLSKDGVVRLTNTVTGVTNNVSPKKYSNTSLSSGRSIALSLDGRYLAINDIDSSKVLIIETATQKEAYRLETRLDNIALSSDGRYLFGSNTLAVYIFDTASGQQRLIYSVPKERNLIVGVYVAFSADGKYLAYVSSGIAHLINVSTGKEIIKTTLLDGVSAVSLSDNGRYFAIANSSAVHVVDTKTGKELEFDGAAPIALSADGHYLVVQKNQNLRIFDVITGEKMFDIRHEHVDFDLALSGNGRYLAVGMQPDHEISTSILVQQMYDLQCFGSSRSPCPKVDNWPIIAHGEISGVRVFDTTRTSNKDLFRITGTSQKAIDAFTADGHYFATMNDSTGYIEIIENATGKTILKRKLNSSRSVVELSPDGRYLAIGSNGGTSTSINTVDVIDVATNKAIGHVKHETRTLQEDSLFSIDLNTNPRYIATGSWNGSADIIDTFSGKVLFQNKQVHNRQQHMILDTAVSGNARYLAYVDAVAPLNFLLPPTKPKAHVIDTSTGKDIVSPKDGDGVGIVALSSDGNYVALVGGSPDGSKETTRIWNVSTGTEISRLLHEAPVYDVQIDADNRYLYSISRDEKEITFTRHLLKSADLIKEACTRLTRNLTPEEGKRYLADSSPKKTCSNLP